MSDREIKDHIISYIKAHSTVSDKESFTIADTTDIMDSGLLNSIDFIDMITALEKKNNITFDLENMDPLEYSTIAGLISAVENAKK
jgi:acyl carrier protein